MFCKHHNITSIFCISSYLVAVLIVSIIMTGYPAFAASKRALVIGNNSYEYLKTTVDPQRGQLARAVADAELVADTFENIGFVVSLVRNASSGEMRNQINRFSRSIEPGDLVFFFYAGHGVNIGGRNFFIPSDIKPLNEVNTLGQKAAEEENLMINSIPESFVAAKLKLAQPKMAALIIDACRNNPIVVKLSADPKRSLGDSIESIGESKGLALPSLRTGLTFFYSADAGQTAADRLVKSFDTSSNSPFTRAFVKSLSQYGITFTQVMRNTMRRVDHLVKNEDSPQTPAYYSKYDGDSVYLNGIPQKVVLRKELPRQTEQPKMSSRSQVIQMIINFHRDISNDVSSLEKYYGREVRVGNRIKSTREIMKQRYSTAQKYPRLIIELSEKSINLKAIDDDETAFRVSYNNTSYLNGLTGKANSWRISTEVRWNGSRFVFVRIDSKRNN